MVGVPTQTQTEQGGINGHCEKELPPVHAAAKWHPRTERDPVK